ncbi:MAG: hypothetical protein ACMXYE_00020 [Candidatus Woesearchaeota archaeon]
MKKKFLSLRKLYDEFHQEMLMQNRLLVKDTGIGYWGVSPLHELFDLFEKTGLKKHKKFLDLGSGDGRAVLTARLFTNAAGIEYDNELHKHAVRLAKKANVDVTFINDDFFNHALHEYDYLFIHPDNYIRNRLERKLQEEMNEKAKLVVFGPHFHPEGLRKETTLDVHGTLVSVFKK